jgi:hypothetical protein
MERALKNDLDFEAKPGESWWKNWACRASCTRGNLTDW